MLVASDESFIVSLSLLPTNGGRQTVWASCKFKMSMKLFSWFNSEHSQHIFRFLLADNATICNDDLLRRLPASQRCHTIAGCKQQKPVGPAVFDLLHELISFKDLPTGVMMGLTLSHVIDLAEDNMLAVEMSRTCCGDEELDLDQSRSSPCPALPS